MTGYVIVSGPPASGKSTLARVLADRLDLPLLAKDALKEALAGQLDVPDLAASRELGRVSVVALVAMAGSGPAVLDSVWHRSRAVALLRELPGPLVEVFCRCQPQVLQERYLARSAGRAGVHFDLQREPAELWNDDTGEPVAGGWPVLEIDTTGELDVEPLVAQVRALLAAGSVPRPAAASRGGTVVTHTVMWRFADPGEAVTAKQLLAQMPPLVPQLRSLQIGVNRSPSPDAYHLVLISTFESWEDLRGYQQHPEHVRLSAFARERCTDLAVVDSEH